jgi:hypothetical protein
LAVFPFDSIDIGGSASVKFVGSRPIALASKGDIFITPTLSVSAPYSGALSNSAVAGPGGYAGNFASAVFNNNNTGTTYREALGLVGNGSGPGGGFSAAYSNGNVLLFPQSEANLVAIATGGGFGGAASSRTQSLSNQQYLTASGGGAYGNLLSSVEGGSGGASAWGMSDNGGLGTFVIGSGGGGGGALAIVANGAVNVNSIEANGASPGYNSGYGLAPGAGGAGGGILLSGSSISFSSLNASGTGGGRIALLGTSSFSFANPVSGASVNGSNQGVITLSPQTFIATDNRVLDGSLLVKPGGGLAPTYEAEVRRNLTVSSGATVTLGKNQPLDKLVGPGGVSTAQLQIDSGGVFDTGNFSQRLGTLLGSGELRLSDGGRITVDGVGGYASAITGTGTLAISPGGTFSAGIGLAPWKGTAEVGGTLHVTFGAFNARVVNVGNAATLQLGLYAGPVDLGGDLSGFRGTIQIPEGTVRVAQPGALDTKSRVVIGDIGGPRLELNATSATIGSLDSSNVSAAIDLGGNLVGNSLYLGADDSNGTFAGTITGIGSNTGVTKIGTGAQTLSGPLTYLGPTIAREGRLTIAYPMDPGGPNGNVRVESAGELRVQASVQRPIAGVGAASVISINTQAAVSLGSATSYLGFSNQGELRVGVGDVTINSAGSARLGGLTTMGGFTGPFFNIPTPGAISVPNGAIVDFGEAITGYGTINSPNALAKRVVVNGAAQGNSAANPLTFTGYVKGTGSFDNVTFTGTFSPGLSPAIVSGSNITLAPSSTLEIELGGNSPGSGYDKLDVSGTLTLGGALVVKLINGYVPTVGDTFDFLDWGVLSGTFSSVTLPNLGPNFAWNASQIYSSAPLKLTYAGDFDFDGDVDGADLLVWQRGGSPTPGSPGDLASWKTNFGASAATATVNSVPEPAGWATMTCLLAIFRRAAIARRFAPGRGRGQGAT